MGRTPEVKPTYLRLAWVVSGVMAEPAARKRARGSATCYLRAAAHRHASQELYWVKNRNNISWLFLDRSLQRAVTRTPAPGHAPKCDLLLAFWRG
jgi:hypothetical protein